MDQAKSSEQVLRAAATGHKEGWIEVPLPFERRGRGDWWYWACSFNQTPPVTEYITYWHRRFDDVLERYIDFQGRRGKVDESSGRYKGYRMPLNILLFDAPLEWYAVGDIDTVRDLCREIAAIGKKPAQGYGIVERWDVAPWPEGGRSGAGGKITRAIPMELGLPPGVKHVAVRLYGTRPPYWSRKPSGVLYAGGGDAVMMDVAE